MESVLKINKVGKYHYICVYYKQKNNRILVNTNVKPVEGKMNDDNWFKDNFRANGLIMQVKNNVDSYINGCRMHRKAVNHRECLQYLKEHYNADIKIREDKPVQRTILQYFSDFVNNKALELNHYNSQRVYNSLETNLKEFEKEYTLTFESINKLDFFYRFRDYSVKTLDHIDNTISKNVAILKSFLSYLQDNEIYTFKSALFNYSVGKTPAQVVTLTAEEIKQIYYCDKYDKFERQLIDVFVFYA